MVNAGAPVRQESVLLWYEAGRVQALRLVEFAFQRYYRLDCSGERGLCERHARSCERCPTTLKPAVALSQVLKDLCHPQVRLSRALCRGMVVLGTLACHPQCSPGHATAACFHA